MRHYGLDALRDLNKMRQKVVADPEIASRLASDNSPHECNCRPLNSPISHRS